MAINQHPPSRRKEIASALSIDEQYAYQIIRGIRVASPALAREWVRIAPEDDLWSLRPNDWHLIWPELIGAPGAPEVAHPDAQAGEG